MNADRLAEIMEWHKDCECGCGEVAAEVDRLARELAEARGKVARVEGEAAAMEELSRDVGAPGRASTLLLAARSIRAALSGGAS